MNIFDRANAPKRTDSWFVYGLVDSREPSRIRYIGVTNNPRARLGLHLSQAHKEGWKKSRWIGSVLSAGSEVLMCELMSGLTQHDAKVKEVALISERRKLGFLMNLTAGGDGCEGQVQSAETRAKKSAALMGRPKAREAVERQAAAIRGRKFTDEQRAALSTAHLKRYQDNEQRRRQSDGLRRRYSDPTEREKTRQANYRRFEDPAERDKLRATTQAAKIASAPTRNNSSGFKGVCFHARLCKWRAYISFNCKRHYLGYFATAELAAEAYDIAALKLFGAGCYLNLQRSFSEA